MATSEMDYMGGDYIIGPAHIDNTTNRRVVFDNLSDNCGYQLMMKDGITTSSVTKTTDTNSGIKLTYVVPATYTNMSGTSTSVTTSNEFYLSVIK